MSASHAFFTEFNDKSRDKGVIVLDQFEELIRFAPAMRQAVFEVISEINKDFDTRLVISLRSEYLHEIRQIGNDARAHSYEEFPSARSSRSGRKRSSVSSTQMSTSTWTREQRKRLLTFGDGRSKRVRPTSRLANDR